MATSNEPADTSILLFPPIVYVCFGIALIAVFIVGCIMSMQTTEAWMLGQQEASIAPKITIFGEFPRFFAGEMAMNESIAFVTAFSIQCILLITKIGLPSVHARLAQKYAKGPATVAMQKSAKRRMGIWSIFSFGALALNAIADIIYAWHLGSWQAAAFSGAMFLATFYCGTFGIQNIAAGMAHMD